MSDMKTTKEETAVDDVRRVRERLSREAGGDIGKLAEQSRQAFEQLREELGLKLVKPDIDPTQKQELIRQIIAART